MRSWRIAARLGADVKLLLLAGSIVIAASLVAAVLMGTAGLVLGVLALQGLVLLLLIKSRIEIGRIVRIDNQRVERHITGKLRSQDARLQRLEHATQLLVSAATDVTTERAKASIDRGEPADAIRLYEEVLRGDPAAVESRIRLIDLLVGQGQLDEARNYAAYLPDIQDATFQLHPIGVRNEALRLRSRLQMGEPAAHPLAAEVNRQLKAGAVESALDLAEWGLELHPESIRTNDRLMSALDAVGKPGRALRLAIANARRRIEYLEARRPQPVTPRTLTPQQRVMICGFFYSGSSAVLDHLLGFPGAVKWTPAGEMRVIKFPGGYGELAERQAVAGQLDKQALLDLYLHLIGRKYIGHGSEIYSTWGMVNRNSRRLLGQKAASGYLQACFEGFQGLATLDPPPSAPDLERMFRATVERALDAAATDTRAELLVVDQAVTAWRLDLARFVPPSTFVVVHRDPRDQFAEVKQVLAQPGRGRKTSRTPEGFAHRYRNDREEADRLIPRLERRHGHRFVRIAFEDFVVDHEREAARLHDALGLEVADKVEQRFDPAVSIANVGKHVGRLSDAEVASLRDLLPEYLSPYADAPHAGREGSHGRG